MFDFSVDYLNDENGEPEVIEVPDEESFFGLNYQLDADVAYVPPQVVEQNLFFEEDLDILNQYKYNQAVQHCVDPLGDCKNPYLALPLTNDLNRG